MPYHGDMLIPWKVFFFGCTVKFHMSQLVCQLSLKLMSNLHPLQVWETNLLKGNLLAQVAMFGTHSLGFPGRQYRGNTTKQNDSIKHQTYQANGTNAPWLLLW